ncbi:MAG: hypothetical protein M3Q06_08985 [Bacteroidota bacterium]|nr:hypothetical protein [Bacteroidota bacterium]
MLLRLKRLFNPKDLTLSVSKAQKELLDLLMINKVDFDTWNAGQASGKIRFHFFYPTAIDFFYDEFKLFTAFFKRSKKDEIELVELKMTETNYDTIRCNSWAPFEEVIINFLTSMEESKKIALFEKRKTLLEYQSLCTSKTTTENLGEDYANALSIRKLKPTP